MKKLIAVSIILLLAMSACKKERQGVDEPNWNAWTFKVVNTSRHDIQVTVGDTTYKLWTDCGVSLPDSLWLWNLAENGALRDIIVDSVVISRNSIPPSVHRCSDGTFTPALHNIYDPNSYHTYYDKELGSFVRLYAITDYD